MKTKDLIKFLNEADPSGELECVVENRDIYHIEKLPGYYDGAAKIILRDYDKKSYTDPNCGLSNVCGMKITKNNYKIQIKTYGIDDMLLDNPDYSIIDDYGNDYTDKKIEEMRNGTYWDENK